MEHLDSGWQGIDVPYVVNEWLRSSFLGGIIDVKITKNFLKWLLVIEHNNRIKTSQIIFLLYNFSVPKPC